MVLDELPVEVHERLVCTAVSNYRVTLNWDIAADAVNRHMMDDYLLILSDEEMNAIMVDASDQLCAGSNKLA